MLVHFHRWDDSDDSFQKRVWISRAPVDNCGGNEFLVWAWKAAKLVANKLAWPHKKIYMQSCVMANKLATGTSKEVFWPTSWPSFFAWVVAAKEDESARCLAGCCRINAFHGYGPLWHAFCFVAMLQMHDHKPFLSSSPLCLQDGGEQAI